MYVGGDAVTKAYIGSNLVYQQGPNDIAFSKTFDSKSQAFLSAAYDAGMCASPNYMTFTECNAVTTLSDAVFSAISSFSNSYTFAFFQFFPNLDLSGNRRIGGPNYKTGCFIIVDPNVCKVDNAWYRFGSANETYNNDGTRNKFVFPTLTPKTLASGYFRQNINAALYFPDDAYSDWCTAAAATAKTRTSDNYEYVVFRKISDLSSAERSMIKITIE